MVKKLLTISAFITLLYAMFFAKNLGRKEGIKILYTALAQGANEIEVDYETQITTGSPLIFGGAHGPYIEHQEAWDMLAEVGITNIRRDFYIESELPKNITLADYKNNVNNIQDPKNWYTKSIEYTNTIYKNAKTRDMQVVGIVAYIPKWLGFVDNHSVPRDWEVYKDIVKKSYRLHRPYLDIVEIWNEPDSTFLSVKGSGLTKAQAYSKIYEVAAKAIREVDTEINDGKIMPIIGPALAIPEKTEIIKDLLSKVDKTYINGISIHSYNKEEPSWESVKSVLADSNVDLPIYVNEWNQSGEYTSNSYFYTNKAITFTADKLISFLKGGVAGANYFSTTFYNAKSTSKYENTFGFYEINNGKTELLPQAKTWKLLSKTLGLGKGPSKILDTTKSIQNAIGFINSEDKLGVAVVNPTSEVQVTAVRIVNLPFTYKATVNIYDASSINDGSTILCTKEIPVENGKIEFLTNVAPESVQGIIVEPIKIDATAILDILGMNTTTDCLGEQTNLPE